MDKIRVAIFGAGEFGTYMVNKSKTFEKYSIDYFVDNYCKEEAVLPVLQASEIKKKMEMGEVHQLWVAVKSYYWVEEILFQLHEMKISPVRVINTRLWSERKEFLTEKEVEDNFFDLEIKEKAFLSKLEYHVCDHCNLNCAGCSHFAPIYKESYSDIHTFEKDVEQLKYKFENIFRFRLMGGEPFLREDLDLFISVARKAFPRGKLELVTNGLLLYKVKNHIWESIKENGAELHISLYPPTFALQKKIKDLLDEKNILYSFGAGLLQKNEDGIIEEFHTGLTENRVHNGQVAAMSCMGNECHFLRNGKISKCALPLLAQDINQYFGKEYVVEEADYVDIYSDRITPWEMLKQLHDATPFCQYCKEGLPTRFPWRVEKAVCFEDYVVGE